MVDHVVDVCGLGTLEHVGMKVSSRGGILTTWGEGV